MNYKDKWRIFEALKPSFASCEVRYEMDKIPQSVKNRVAKAFSQGYTTVRGGSTGVLYHALGGEFEIDKNFLFKGTRQTWDLGISNASQELFDELVEYSKADCVAHLMDLATGTNKDSHYSSEYFRKYYLGEKNHKVENIRHWYFGLNVTNAQIFSLKNEKAIKEIICKHILTDEYKSKIDKALKFLSTPGSSLIIKYEA